MEASSGPLMVSAGGEGGVEEPGSDVEGHEVVAVGALGAADVVGRREDEAGVARLDPAWLKCPPGRPWWRCDDAGGVTVDVVGPQRSGAGAGHEGHATPPPPPLAANTVLPSSQVKREEGGTAAEGLPGRERPVVPSRATSRRSSSPSGRWPRCPEVEEVPAGEEGRAVGRDRQSWTSGGSGWQGWVSRRGRRRSRGRRPATGRAGRRRRRRRTRPPAGAPRWRAG